MSSSQPVLFVTHATEGSQWQIGGLPRPPEIDYETIMFAKPGIDAAVRAFKARGWPVIYLTAAVAPVIMEDRKPTATLFSNAGKHSVSIPTRHVFIAGGEMTGCAWTGTAQASLAAAVVYQRKRFPGQRPVVALHFILDALFGPELWDAQGAQTVNTPEDKLRLFRDRMLSNHRRLLSVDLKAPQIELFDGDAHLGRVQKGDRRAPLLKIQLLSSRDLGVIGPFGPQLPGGDEVRTAKATWE